MKLLTALPLLLALLTSACIQLPTEKQEVADLRPQLSFALADPTDDLGLYQVFIDELNMGTASIYATGKNALKVISGTHVIKVEGRGRVVMQERVYLGDGATRTILIPKP